ncbi:acyl-CoA N-acyltransferase [Mycena albidolilacea]|uniref:Acyl-CoA N-acyltransferase n=1 Tax=Mycena albidolilacea TaxID=1033008 RepID=A0AAD7AIX6_9AGAR|nr:acyl-CoA N-acyltransferase [Mycena albidolilacea]
MAQPMSRPSPVVLPRSGGDIIIRQFHPKDADQVHALLIEGLVYGPESPHNTAQARNLYSRISCLAYFGCALGLWCLCSRNIVLRISGGALTLGAAALFIYMRRSITKMFVDFCANARATDMADICHSYEVPLPVDGVQAPVPQGPAGFWVAAIESPESKTSEVVGYLGLDYRGGATAISDPSTGELRRMIVSMNHRRRKIGSLLMTAAMDHARRHMPPLETLDLETSEFQPGARKLYEKHGFSFVGKRTLRSSPLFSMAVLRFRRRILD